MVLAGWQRSPIPLDVIRKDKIPTGFAQAPDRTTACEHGYCCQQRADNANRMDRCFHMCFLRCDISHSLNKNVIGGQISSRKKNLDRKSTRLNSSHVEIS